MERSTLDKVRENLRLQKVYNVFLRYGFDLGISRWAVVDAFRRRMQRWVWGLPEDMPTLSTPTKVRLMLEELGPTYVKMGQIVSSQASNLPPEWANELEKLQSNVPPFPAYQVREIIIEELKAPPEELYALFEPEPFAAASTAQVHHAVLHDGTKAAIKVQRPHIREQMKADMGIMDNAAQVVTSRSKQAAALDLVGMLDQFSSSVLDELDYQNEAYNAARLAENMQTLPGVHITTIYHNLSTDKVLTMEFVEGVKASDVEALDAAGLDRETIARNALRAVAKQLLIDGFFHADPHPGNILVNPKTGVITFIDTGMVGVLDLNQRLNVIQLLVAVQQLDVMAMAQVLKAMSVPFGTEHDEVAYYKDFERRVGRFLYLDETVDFTQAVNVGLDILRTHGYRLDPNLTMAIKALVQAQAIALLLYPQGGIINEGIQLIRELVLDEFTADNIMEALKQQVGMRARDAIQQVPSLLEASGKWLEQYRKGRFEVYVDTSGLGKEVDKLTGFGRQIVLAIILTGMIIGSAIASALAALGTSVTGPLGDVWNFISRLAYVGYVVSMVIAMLLVARLIWRWFRGRSPVED
jgi:ubiquinone biosynthesis protein